MAANNYYTYANPAAAVAAAAYGAPSAATATYQTPQPSYSTGAGAPVGYDAAYQTAGAAYYQQTQTAAAAPAYSIDYDQSKSAAAAYVTSYAQNAVNAQGIQGQYTAPAAAYPITATYPATGYAPVPTQNSTVTTQGYDAALYSAATMYMAQQSSAAQAAAVTNAKVQKQTWNKLKKGKIGFKPNTQQLHYCEICKISCAGAQTYKEHLDGSKHKKKEAASKLTGTAAATTNSRGANVIKCNLCAVSCTGNDAYAAHIRGSKHQRVLMLHNKLGKPIPEQEVIVATTKSENGEPKSIYSGTPKISFVASGELSTSKTTNSVTAQSDNKTDMSADAVDDIVEKDCHPIGQEYVDEIRGEDGKLVTFHCKLCDCRFNDPNAKEMHMKGRKHRLQYKLKVDPNLHVEIKPYMQQKLFGKDFKFGKGGWKKGVDVMANSYSMNNWYGQQNYSTNYGMSARNYGQNMMPQMPGNYYMGRKVDSYDDRHVLSKHELILPNEDEANAIKLAVERIEQTLTIIKERVKVLDANRVEIKVIKGVMRVGHYHKNILLSGEKNVQLVVTCDVKPTLSILKEITSEFNDTLKGGYVIRAEPDHSAVSISSNDVRVMVSLTSTLMREEGASSNSADVLPLGKCLQALAALRHANWFQKKATTLKHCGPLVRVMRSHCQNNPVWAPLDAWPLELFVQKIIESSENMNLGLGDLFRRLMEAVAGGFLLHGSPGLADLCEKDNPDALEYLTDQQREDITNSAQTALRFIAFRQIHKVLGVEKITGKKKIDRKRPLDGAADEGTLICFGDF